VKNYFFEGPVQLGLTINGLLSKATYTDEMGVVRKLDPIAIDVEDDNTYDLISLYPWYHQDRI
jgi:hypothetical protein